jgi:hypothetical protein
MADDAAGDTADDAAPASARRRVPARASRVVPTGAPPTGARPDGGRPKRWSGRSLVWAALVVVVLGAALAASFLSTRDPDNPEPSGDTTEFCARIRVYDEQRLASETTGAPTDVAALAAALRRVEEVAEPVIRPSVTDVRQGSEEVAAELATSATIAEGADLTAGLDLADRVQSRTRRSYDRLTHYTLRACDIDLAAVGAPRPATTPLAGSAPR